MQETFQCTNCRAALDLPKEKGEKTVTCPFCGTTVIVPAELRQPEEVQRIHVSVDQRATSGQGRSRVGLVIVALVLCSLIGVVTALVTSSSMSYSIERMVQEGFSIEEVSTMVVEIEGIEGPEIIEEAVPAATPTPGFVTEVLRFGGEGTGPGLLNDSRWMAVDGEGYIYTADYDTGRVQVFDAEGQYVTHWLLPDEPIILDIDADRQGNLYVVTGGSILRFEGQTGTQNGELVASGYSYFDDVYVASNGTILAASTPASDTALVVFGPDGGVQMVIDSPIESVANESELDTNLAMDGLGNIYALGSFTGSVFVYNASGQYQTRFGSEGTEEGQFRSLHEIDVDGQGRIYVADSMGIFVFAPDGRLLTVIDIDGVPFGLDFDSEGYLYVSNRDEVFKFQVNE